MHLRKKNLPILKRRSCGNDCSSLPSFLVPPPENLGDKHYRQWAKLRHAIPVLEAVSQLHETKICHSERSEESYWINVFCWWDSSASPQNDLATQSVRGNGHEPMARKIEWKYSLIRHARGCSRASIFLKWICQELKRLALISGVRYAKVLASLFTAAETISDRLSYGRSGGRANTRLWKDKGYGNYIFMLFIDACNRRSFFRLFSTLVEMKNDADRLFLYPVVIITEARDNKLYAELDE